VRGQDFGGKFVRSRFFSGVHRAEIKGDRENDDDVESQVPTGMANNSFTTFTNLLMVILILLYLNFF
jgi:hypothetical protein